MARVHLGYFADFKGSDTLLIEGDTEGLRQLIGILRALQNGAASSAEIHALPFVQSHHGVRLTATRAHHDRVTRSGPGSIYFSWERTERGWQDAADKVEVLVEPGPGHHYLDAAGDQAVIQVSKGEYGDHWWSHHG